LDPLRAGDIAVAIGKRMGDLDPTHASEFNINAEGLKRRLIEKTRTWQERIKLAQVTKVITFHRTLSYFLDRFGIELAAILEPKPGIPPTSGHIMNIIKVIREKKIRVILIENYFDPTVANKIRDEIPQIRSATVGVAVEGTPKLTKLDDVYESIVSQIEGKL
jgi:zinc/manganese transport system substrate-binding protein